MSDNANWNQMWNSSQENLIALSNVYNMMHSYLSTPAVK